MQDIMMVLGTYIFSIDTATYQQLTKSVEYRWKNQEIINGQDVLQFTGEAPTTVTLTGTIYPHFKGGLGQLDILRAIASKGNPLILVDGRGFVHGLWVIERIEEFVDAFFGQGMPRKQKFIIQIKKYGGLRKVIQTGIVESFIGDFK
ncbi:MAG: phage tail protein [Desulfobacteraceae bacterium]|nr:phage tail protein [Desulfobacteraceae bacterium]